MAKKRSGPTVSTAASNDKKKATTPTKKKRPSKPRKKSIPRPTRVRGGLSRAAITTTTTNSAASSTASGASHAVVEQREVPAAFIYQQPNNVSAQYMKEASPMELAEELLQQCDDALVQAQPSLEMAKGWLEQARVPGSYISHLTTKSNNTHSSATTEHNNNSIGTGGLTTVTTIGHCNTDHEVVWTGDPVVDRLADLKRAFHQRHRMQQPENKGQERWDKPRLPGQRRRRIVRDMDQPGAPAAKPPSGYVIFVGQMTTKIRHDRPHVQHHQPTVVQEIAKVWRDEMSAADRQYYTDFSEEVHHEFEKQQMEFRATGRYTPSTAFERLGGGGIWVRKLWDEKNGLEKEISQYETYEFPPRPPELEETYQWNRWKSQVNRKLKMRGLIENSKDAEEQTIVEQALHQAKEKWEENLRNSGTGSSNADDEGQPKPTNSTDDGGTKEEGEDEKDTKALVLMATKLAVPKIKELKQRKR